MRIVDCTQNTPEWFQARLGRVGASRVCDIVAKTKTGISAMRAAYAAELVAERLTGAKVDGYQSAAMVWGMEQEPVARSLYEFMKDISVEQVGFVLHPSMDMAGASPDGLVGDSGLIEIKAPSTHTHIETLLGGPIDPKYVKQMQWQMACTERQWCDFASFDPRLPSEMQLHVRRVKRDDVMIAELEKEVATFLGEVATTVERLRDLYLPKQEAA